MDIKEQIISAYLTQGGGFRKLAAKYGISRTTICKWVALALVRVRKIKLRMPLCVSLTQRNKKTL